MLRCIFDSYGNDQDSEHIIRHYDFEQLEQRRHISYQYLLNHMSGRPQLTVISPALKKGTASDHFTVYTEDRDMVQSYLTGCGIKTITH